MAENLNRKPRKGILKNSSSFDVPDSKSKSKKSKGSAKWDEMNILATLHPPDKDYGHMKIDEPKTPYNYEDMSNDVLDAAELAEKIKLGAATMPKALQSSEDDEEDDADLTPEQREEKREFENKRKKHYNEFYAVKLARKLLEEEDDDDEDEESAQGSSSKTNV